MTDWEREMLGDFLEEEELKVGEGDFEDFWEEEVERRASLSNEGRGVLWGCKTHIENKILTNFEKK